MANPTSLVLVLNRFGMVFSAVWYGRCLQSFDL
uniref:Uncharacterized protein n=1 Tax=Rhizophora mucronata TaxID=61149 RepID=A0A2P2NX64_RHIMU